MRKKKESLDKPRIKGLRILCIGIAAIWIVASLGVYRESKREKFDLSAKPGAVTYGTHTAPVIPMVSVSTRRTVLPMVSGSEVRSFARYGHAATQGTTAGNDYRLYTTSSAISRSEGRIGSAGGGSLSSSSSSSRHSGAYTVESMISMIFASSTANTPMSPMVVTPTNLATASLRRNIGPLRSRPDYDGTGGQEVEKDGETWYWDEGKEDWVNITPIGTTKEEDGYYWEWNGTTWVRKSQVADLGTPVGDTPWLIMMFLAVVYVLKRKKIIFDNIGNF